MSVYLIRHGKTLGNLEKRYIGKKTDEPLCEEGINELKLLNAPPVDIVFSSPLKRCVETAKILYPHIEPIIIDDFCETDFGDFEGKCYNDLKDDPYYQKWVDSMGELPFLNGESKVSASLRAVNAFKALDLDAYNEVAVIAHGGTVMAIMEAFSFPRGNYYDFQVKNGSGYKLNKDGSYEKL